MARPTRFHDYTTVVTDIDRRKYGSRVVPMKVLCVGMDRTGTDSLRKALKLVGISEVYHGWNACMENPRDCEMWAQAFRAKFEGKGKPFGRAEFDMLLGHCQAVIDNPCICFAEELIAAYPEAKVILTKRHVNDWYKSHAVTVEAVRFNPTLAFVAGIGWYLRVHSRYALSVFRKGQYHMFQGEDFKTQGKRKFEEHYDRIRRLVPPNQLLELQLGDGWDPLCKFLNVDRPNVAYPFGNTIDDVNKKFEAAFWYTCRIVGKRLALCILVTAGLALVVRRLCNSYGRRCLGFLTSKF